MQNYKKRSIEKQLTKAAKTFPSVILTGPRQSGKTTLVNHLFQKTHTFISFDDPDLRTQAAKDPKLFLLNYPPPLIIDEVQYVPEIFSYLKIIIDSNPHKKNQFILTGSQLFPLMARASESLAGRMAVFNLLPFSLTEKFSHSPNLIKLKQFFLTGGFPQINLDSSINRQTWFSSYIQTYLERDIRQIKQVADLTDFQRFLQLSAANNGQLINLSNFSNDLGVAVNTIKSWLSLLEASGQIVLIKPYYKNRGKRLTKRPKLYFLDSGIFCHLVGLTSINQVFTGPLSGSHLETLCLAEIYKHFYSHGLIPKLYYWRTSAQQEIDFILENNGQILPIEVKLSSKSTPKMIKPLDSFIKLFSLKKGFLINLSNKTTQISPKIKSLPINNFINKLN